MKLPRPLQKGDTIALVSTARKITVEEIAPAVSMLKNWGFEVVIGKTIGAEENQFAGNDALRAADLQQMLDDPNVRAVWCARGGYGTVRIVDTLNFDNFLKDPKWITGFSDVTVLHSHLHKLGVATLHAPMPFGMARQAQTSVQAFENALFGREASYQIAANAKNRNGRAEGLLVGGNLSILYALCGSPSAIDTSGKILFLEDLDEYLYHVDRMMQNLKRNGLFENLAGLVVGQMTKMNDNPIPFGKTAEEIIQETVSGYDFPVCFGFPAGHSRDNHSLVLGKESVLNISHKGVQLVN